MKAREFLLVALTLFLFGCGTIKSGHYVQLKQGESLKDLAKSLDVPLWKIQAANQGRSIASGSWVFVPLDRGVYGGAENFYNTQQFLDSGDFLWPVPASKRISSHFGKRWGRKHEGIDIAARTGASILAAEGGVAVYSGKMGGYGNIIVLAHEGGFFTVYAHNNRNHIRKGQKVHRGQVIGEVGSTGRSTGPHLHFEIRHNSKSINPKDFLAFKGK